MEFEWSEEKRLRTLEERGLEFRDAFHLFDGRPIYTYASPRGEEARFVSIGVLEGEFVAVVWMDRMEQRRVISMRRARHGEERTFRSLLS
jgi:uncharacterized DUF497 family protein